MYANLNDQLYYIKSYQQLPQLWNVTIHLPTKTPETKLLVSTLAGWNQWKAKTLCKDCTFHKTVKSLDVLENEQFVNSGALAGAKRKQKQKSIV